jgi:hypothetical protein
MFTGAFVPPTIGRADVPIPLAGDGTLDVTDAGLAVQAFRASSGGLAALAFLAMLIAGLGGAWLVTRALDVKMSERVIAGVIVGSILAAAAIPRKGKHKKPWALVFPWPSVRKVMVDKQTGLVVVTIKKHKPKGQLHLRATGDATEVVQAIEARLSPR